MATRVLLQNPQSNQIRVIKVGFSWTSFFFGTFFGIPLFLRGLTGHGLFMVGFYFAYTIMMIMAQSSEAAAGGAVLLWFLAVGLAFFYGFRANAMAGQKYLAEGWQFAKPDSSEALIAASAWSIALPQQTSHRRGTQIIETDQTPVNDSIDKLERLVALKQKGLLSDEEFAAEKSKTI